MPRPRVTVRRLIKWVAVTAVVLAIVRYPYQTIRRMQHFRARERAGEALLQSYAAQRPPGVSPGMWSEAIAVVQIAWGNVVFSPEYIDDADLDAILAELRGMAPLATPADAEGELYHILDLLAHARTRAGVHYLSMMRYMFKSALPGYGRPSPGPVVYALSRLGSIDDDPPVDRILGGMRTDDWTTRVACCRALGQYALGLGTQAESRSAIAGLIRALEDNDRLVREIAVECFHEIGPAAASAREAIVDRRARDPEVRVRWQAVRALPAIEKDPSALIPALVAAIDDVEPVVRNAALDALGEMGPPARAALPAIRGALTNPDEDTRGAAMPAIARVAPPTEVAVPALVNALKTDPSWDVRAKAIEALAGLGAKASPALPALIECLDRDDAPAVHMAAALAVARVAPDDLRTIAALSRALRTGQDEYVRRNAAMALGEIGPPAAAAIPSLTDALKDTGPQVRDEAEASLKKIRARP